MSCRIYAIIHGRFASKLYTHILEWKTRNPGGQLEVANMIKYKIQKIDFKSAICETIISKTTYIRLTTDRNRF